MAKDEKKKPIGNPDIVNEVGVATEQEVNNAKPLQGEIKPVEMPDKIGATTKYTPKIKSYEELANETIDARNRQNKKNDEADEKRLKTMRTIGTITNVLGGIGNMIGAIHGAKPVEQDQTLLNNVQQAYADKLAEKRKRAQEDLEMMYSARAADIKQAKAEREAQAKRDARIEELDKKYQAQMAINEYREAMRRNLELYKQTNKLEYLEAANKAKRDLEEYRQGEINKRNAANIASREEDNALDRELREATVNAQEQGEWGKPKLVEEYKPKKEEKPKAQPGNKPKTKKYDD